MQCRCFFSVFFFFFFTHSSRSGWVSRSCVIIFYEVCTRASQDEPRKKKRRWRGNGSRISKNKIHFVPLIIERIESGRDIQVSCLFILSMRCSVAPFRIFIMTCNRYGFKEEEKKEAKTKQKRNSKQIVTINECLHIVGGLYMFVNAEWYEIRKK